MSTDFFNSKVVQDCVQEIGELQMEVMLFAQYSEFATYEEKLDHVRVLRVLVDKQKNMYYRCHLSNSKQAKSMMKDMEEHFIEMGFETPENVDETLDYFDRISESIDEIEQEFQV